MSKRRRRKKNGCCFGNQANDCLEPRSLTSAILLRKFPPRNKVKPQTANVSAIFLNTVEWLERLLSIALDMLCCLCYGNALDVY